MNERINELINQCFIGTSDGNLSGLNTVANIEKFAELIVKECISVARRQRNPSNLNYKPSERFVEELQQYFGVKE